MAAKVSVRNTFVDDFVAEASALSTALYTTLPAELPTLLESRAPDAAPEPEPVLPPAALLQTGEWPVACAPPPELRRAFRPPPGLPVRNTFIELRDEGHDERATRSMPHGMFGKELLAETPMKIALPAASQPVLQPGAVVVVSGLVKLPAFNGCRGLVKGYDAKAERYTVKLHTTEGEQIAKVRRENLQHPSQLASCQMTAVAAGEPASVLPASPPGIHKVGGNVFGVLNMTHPR